MVAIVGLVGEGTADRARTQVRDISDEVGLVLAETLTLPF
jgi:hypothetical protein